MEPARRELVAAAAAAGGVTVVDTTPWFCTPAVCPAVVGNLLVWRDNSHITNPYARMLTPLLARHLPR